MVKKSFKEAIGANANPAMAFLSRKEEGKPAEAKTEQGEAAQPEPVRRGDWKHRVQHERGAETYSKRVQLLMRPSTQQAIKTLADAKGKSVNNFINDVLEEYLEGIEG